MFENQGVLDLDKNVDFPLTRSEVRNRFWHENR